MRSIKSRIRFGNVMFILELLSSHFSPLLQWNSTLFHKHCAGHTHLSGPSIPGPFWDGVACRHMLPLGTRWLPGL